VPMSESTTQSLFITCPVCGEELEVTPDDLATLQVGDVIVCDSCGAELEITSLDPPEFELLGLLTTCPNCGEEVELTDEMIIDGTVITCPNCSVKFEVEFEDVDERPQA
jgi:lysine biosynthesis protein LysW